MKFCTKCGSKLKEDQSVCPNCGYNFETKKYENDADDDTQEIDKQEITDKERFYSGRKKTVILCIIIAAIAIVSFILIGRSITGPNKIAARFQSDISSNNKSDLSKILCSNDNRLKMDESSSSALLKYFKDNPSYLNKVLNNMNTQLSNKSLIKEKSTVPQQGNFIIVKDGSVLLFFPKYRISVKPTFIDINASIKGIELSLNGNKIGKSDTDDFNKEFGPFLPGEYKLYANYKGKYTSLNKTYNVDLVNSTNGRVNVDVFKDLSYVEIDGDYPDAEIFINNRNTKVKISDAENFGPVSPGTRIYAIANEDGKKLKSDEYTVASGDKTVNLNFSDSEAQMNNIEDQIHSLVDMYTNSFCSAINYGDFSYVEPYIYPGSSLYNLQKKYVVDTYDKGINENIMSYNIVSYNLSDDNQSGTVNTEEVYNITTDNDSYEKNFKYTYGFKYNEDMGSYQLTSIAVTK